jgi:hypothetical protein
MSDDTKGVHWALLAVGFGFFGFALAAISGIALSYLMDCYQEVSTSLVLLHLICPLLKFDLSDYR